MKNPFLIFMIIVVMGFSIQLKAQSNINQIECKKSVPFGNIKICLSEVDGMTECYNTSKVKEYLDKLNYNNNPIFAYYVNNSDFMQLDKLSEKGFDDYCIIFAIDKMKNVPIDESKLNSITNIIEKDYIRENWDELKKKMVIPNDYISFGRPILIESYTLNNKIKTSVLLNKIKNDDKEKVQIQIMNFIQIKERLISMSYYLVYNGEKSFNSAKSKNDYLVLLLMDENE